MPVCSEQSPSPQTVNEVQYGRSVYVTGSTFKGLIRLDAGDRVFLEGPPRHYGIGTCKREGQAHRRGEARSDVVFEAAIAVH